MAGVEEATKLSNPDVLELLHFLQTKMTPSEVVLNGLSAITQLIDVEENGKRVLHQSQIQVGGRTKAK